MELMADVAWEGPHGGLPPFASLSAAALDTAYRAAIQAFRGVARGIAEQTGQPSFADTVAPLQEAERAFAKADAMFRYLRYTAMTAAAEPVLTALASLKPALDDELAWDAALFGRIVTVGRSEALTASERRTTGLILAAMRQRGAGLPADRLALLRDLNHEIATLESRFQSNLLADIERLHVPVQNQAELAGLDTATVELLRREAQARALDAPFCVPCARPVVDTVLATANARPLREKVWRMWGMRGEASNPEVVRRILELRAEKAALLGHACYADMVAEGRMAEKSERAVALVEVIADHAVKAANRHSEKLMQLAQAKALGGRIEPWDRPWLNQIMSAADRGFNDSNLSEYLLLDNMIAGMFWAAEALYDCTFVRLDASFAYRPDVTAYEVRQRGKLVAILWLDLVRRNGKRPLAWLDEYRGRLAAHPDEPAILALHHYLSPPAQGEPQLLSWEEARVLFHELGHALHSLLTVVDHPAQGMTRVAWDMIEMPSQMFEHLVTAPEVLGRFARHYRTGEPMPQDMQATLAKGALFDPGAWVLSLAGPALVDLRLHRIADGESVDPVEVEREVLADMRMPHDVDCRHGVLNFAHVFAEAYGAGYYCYHWADVMVADAIDIFMTGGGLFDRDTARQLERELLSVGAAVPPSDAYRAFAQREPTVSALIRKLGLDY